MNFIKYKWIDGDTLYKIDSLKVFKKFLSFFDELIGQSNFKSIKKENISKFYFEKTNSRIKLFTKKNGVNYLEDSFSINGKICKPLNEYIQNLKFDNFKKSKTYNLFHGDLQFDNIIYDLKNSKFSYIDWRDSFGGDTDGGDIYYDFAKLYGGLIFNYFDLKSSDIINFEKGDSIVNFKIEISNNLNTFRDIYEKWLDEKGYDLDFVKFITAIIFLNMSPLHEGNFSKILWFKSIEMLANFDQ